MLTGFLLAVICVLALACAWFWATRHVVAAERASEWRLAMDFIAEEFCDMPHEFAACFVCGNQAAIAEKFPDFAEFRRQRLTIWEDQ